MTVQSSTLTPDTIAFAGDSEIAAVPHAAPAHEAACACRGFALDPEKYVFPADTPWNLVFSLPTILEGVLGARVVVHARNCTGRCRLDLARTRGVQTALDRLDVAHAAEKDMDNHKYAILSRRQMEERLRRRTAQLGTSLQADSKEGIRCVAGQTRSRR